jgi:basic membrane lipoprotein Med (substrate-binding protein (PBP1-ABC) superfamily)
LQTYETSLNKDRHIIINDDGDKIFMDDPSTTEIEHENVLSIPFKAQEASFLAGVMASIYVVDK